MGKLDPETIQIEGLTVILERIPEDACFHSYDAETKMETIITGKQVREELLNIARKLAPKLAARGIRCIEIGSIAWFTLRGKTYGRFIPLNTMFLMRLLKHRPNSKGE
jgi:hypothetical protein